MDPQDGNQEVPAGFWYTQESIYVAPNQVTGLYSARLCKHCMASPGQDVVIDPEQIIWIIVAFDLC